MKDFVMFGYSHLFGDFVDIIHLLDGRLAAVYQNMEAIVVPGRRTLRQRIEALKGTVSEDVAVRSGEEFRKQPNACYVMGFTGVQMQPWRDRLRAEHELYFEPLVHPTAQVSPTVKVPEGVILNARCVVASGVAFEPFVFVNRGATVGHDSTLQEFAVVQPGATIAGYVTVERGAVVGLGATVIEDRRIGEGAMVAAGAVVTADVPAHCMVAGVPAKVKKSIGKE